jgi:hypothetical protein
MFVEGQTGTQVSGIISSDTTWTPANSPYEFSAPVGIAQGITLTIEPGVTINIGTNLLQINGTLNARGTASLPIIFNGSCGRTDIWAIQGLVDFTETSTNWNSQTNTGCIIENARFNNTIIQIEASPTINNCVINCPIYPIFGLSASNEIEINAGSPIISNNSIIANDDGTSIMNGIKCAAGAPVISDNFISGWWCTDIFVTGGTIDNKKRIS